MSQGGGVIPPPFEKEGEEIAYPAINFEKLCLRKHLCIGRAGFGPYFQGHRRVELWTGAALHHGCLLAGDLLGYLEAPLFPGIPVERSWHWTPGHGDGTGGMPTITQGPCHEQHYCDLYDRGRDL